MFDNIIGGGFGLLMLAVYTLSLGVGLGWFLELLLNLTDTTYSFKLFLENNYLSVIGFFLILTSFLFYRLNKRS